MRINTKQMILISIATFAVAGLMLSCSNLTELGAKSGPDTVNSSTFQLSGLSINPGTVAARDEVVITAEVTNANSVDDTYNAELKINNVTEASNKVLVPAGKTQALTFVVFKDKTGTYNVTLGKLAGQFAVVESVAAGPPNQTPALTGQSGPSCCVTGGQVAPVPGQTGASCCGSGVQNNPATQSRPAGGGCCGGR